MTNYLDILLQSVLPAGGTGFVTWFFTRRRSELQNVQEAITIWRQTADEMTERYNEMAERHNQIREDLEKERIERRKERQEMSGKIDVLTGQNEKLIEKLSLMEKDYRSLSTNYKNLKKKLEETQGS